MRKTGLLSVFIVNLLLMTACSSFTTTLKASNAFNNKEYVASSQLILNYLEENKQQPAPKEMVNLLNKNIQQLQKKINSLPATDYDNKIKIYQELRKITVAANNVPYTQSMKIITPPLNLIDISLAEQYYLQGNAIIPQETADYLTKANRYQEGLKYYNYKDMKKQMEENNLTYSTRFAEEHYQKALTYLEVKNYETACKELEQIIDVYKPYGNYKDSQQLFDKYDPIWRKNKADQFYNQAQTLAKTANSADEYKTIRDLYKNAYQIHSQYGAYKEANELSKKYNHLWCKALAEDNYNQAERYATQGTKNGYRKAAHFYELASQSYQEYGTFKDSQSKSILMKQKGIITIKHTQYSNIDSEIEAFLRYTLEDFFNEDSFQYNAISADLEFKTNLSVKKEDIDKVISEEDIYEPPYTYKKIETLKKRVYIINGGIDFNNANNRHINIEKTSSVTHIHYIGLRPKKLKDQYIYDNSSANDPKSFEALQKEALDSLGIQLTQHYFEYIKKEALDNL